VVCAAFHCVTDFKRKYYQENLCEVAKRYFQELFTPKGGVLEPVLSLISIRVSGEDNTIPLSLHLATRYPTNNSNCVR
jgi:hypothetical protein